MSAMLQLWSHTRTLKAPRVIITFRSMTSLSAGDTRAANRKHNNTTRYRQADVLRRMFRLLDSAVVCFHYTYTGMSSLCVNVALTGLSGHCLVLCLRSDFSLWSRDAARRQCHWQEVDGWQQSLSVEHEVKRGEGHLEKERVCECDIINV